MRQNSQIWDQVGELFSVLGNPFRLALLYAIGSGEVCVCHLEEVLDKRQPYISQHLSALRDQDLLLTRREGRYIFYRLADPGVFELIRRMGKLAGLSRGDLPAAQTPESRPGCPCPSCEGDDLMQIQEE